MPSLSALRDAIKATVDTIPDVYVYDYIPDNPTLPAVAVAPNLCDFDVAFGRGQDTWEFELIVLTARGSDRAGQDKMDLLVTGAGTSSIRQAIFQSQGLGLADTNAHVAGMSSYLPTDVAGVSVYSARLRLVVHTSGTT